MKKANSIKAAKREVAPRNAGRYLAGVPGARAAAPPKKSSGGDSVRQVPARSHRVHQLWDARVFWHKQVLGMVRGVFRTILQLCFLQLIDAFRRSYGLLHQKEPSICFGQAVYRSRLMGNW